MNTQMFDEKLTDYWLQRFSMDEMIHSDFSAAQSLIIFQNKMYGKVLTLDNVVQLTERDEHMYSEMFAHVPLMALDNPKNVLIIGGGDGCILREVIKHQDIGKIVLVEIDANVVETSKKFLEDLHQNSFDDPRVEIVIQDGFEYLKETDLKFDAILCDSTDPIGLAKVLFTQNFYHLCLQAMSPQGVLLTQSGVSMLQLKQLMNAHGLKKDIFKHNGFIFTNVPTYIGGMMTLSWGGYKDLNQIDMNDLIKRFEEKDLKTRYYNPGIHQASLNAPQYVVNALNGKLDERFVSYECAEELYNTLEKSC